jgi:hypothetical protein
MYIGAYVHENMDFDRVCVRFAEDAIVSICFQGFCDTDCAAYGSSFIERIHTRYNDLACADSSLFVYPTISQMEGFKTWSREDDQSAVVTMQNDSSCFCAYLATSKMFEVSLIHAYKKVHLNSPNYAEENKVYGVGGVKFGDSRENVKRVILSKSSELLEEDAYSMLFTDVKIGGVIYDFARFYFLPNQGLVSVNLQSAFYEWRKEEALMKFESVKGQYERKYTNLTLLADDEDLKGYQCGAYIDGYDYLPILISFQKSLSKGGDIMYYVQVDYYNHRTDNLYDDEI